ncbi:MAG: DUF1214 domain-containing protein [Gammaproteobacteria bacterium]
MAYGDGPHDEALRTAWHAFCERLKAAGDLVFKDVNPPTSLQRADGFRYLTQNLSQAFDLALETRDTRFPAVHAFCSPTRKLGSDNADCIYLQAWIDGQSAYRISGNKGSARFWNITIQGPRPPSGTLHDPFGDTPEANLVGGQLHAEWDGSFVLYVGGERRGPNWLPTTPGSRKIFFRQYFDRWDEAPAAYRIERLGMDGPRPVPTHATMIDAMGWAGNFVYDVVDYWPDFLWEHTELIDPLALNRFNGLATRLDRTSLDQDEDDQDVRRGRILTQMRWALGTDEALIVEFENFDAFWMFTNEGMFGNSMDYLYRPVSWTPARTAVDGDGRIRLVMAHRDPGVHNWIDTQGYSAGVLTFRNVLSRHVPKLHTRVVPHGDIPLHLPPATRTVSPPERQAQMLERFHAIRRRYRL